MENVSCVEIPKEIKMEGVSKELRYQMTYDYCRCRLAHWHGVKVVDRCAMLHYLCVIRRLPLAPLDLFMSRGQYHLLKWACEHGLVDLQGKLQQTQTSLKPEAFAGYSGLTVAEYLCELAAKHDEVQMLSWLIAHIPNKQFVNQDKNLLQLAMVNSALSVTMWLCANGIIDPATPNAQGDTALHKAARDEHHTFISALANYVPYNVQNSKKETPLMLIYRFMGNNADILSEKIRGCASVIVTIGANKKRDPSGLLSSYLADLMKKQLWHVLTDGASPITWEQLNTFNKEVPLPWRRRSAELATAFIITYAVDTLDLQFFSYIQARTKKRDDHMQRFLDLCETSDSGGGSADERQAQQLGCRVYVVHPAVPAGNSRRVCILARQSRVCCCN